MYGKVSEKNKKYFRQIRKFNPTDSVQICNEGPYDGCTGKIRRSRRNIRGQYFYDVVIDQTGEVAIFLEKELEHEA